MLQGIAQDILSTLDVRHALLTSRLPALLMLVWALAAITHKLLCFTGPLKLSTVEYDLAAEVGCTVVHCIFLLVQV